MNTYRLKCDYWWATLTPVDLQFWEQDRVNETARDIVTRRAQGPQPLSFSSISSKELRDAVNLAAEQLSTHPDEDLDYYFFARRGLRTYYDSLFLGVNGKDYLRSASLPGVGEGLAVHLLKDWLLHPNLFDLYPYIRPLGATPDLIMRYRSDDSRYALVEAKATEKEDLTGELTSAMTQLFKVFQGWQNHRALKKTDGFAVATSIFYPGTFRVSILKVVF